MFKRAAKTNLPSPPADKPAVIEIKRHLVKHGIRRAPGQVLTMTRAQIREQGLEKEDYKFV